jgi:hypothetical protein
MKGKDVNYWELTLTNFALLVLHLLQLTILIKDCLKRLK